MTSRALEDEALNNEIDLELLLLGLSLAED